MLETLSSFLCNGKTTIFVINYSELLWSTSTWAKLPNHHSLCKCIWVSFFPTLFCLSFFFFYVIVSRVPAWSRSKEKSVSGEVTISQTLCAFSFEFCSSFRSVIIARKCQWYIYHIPCTLPVLSPILFCGNLLTSVGVDQLFWAVVISQGIKCNSSGFMS